MSDERSVGEPPPEDAGADTERFRAFVREGQQLEERERPGRGLRVLAAVAGLLALAAVVALLLR